MKYLDYREQKQQGTYEFPLAFYDVDPTSHYYQMPYHWHPEYEIILIQEGSFKLTLGGETFQAQKDDIIFIHAGVLHGGVPDNCIYQCIVFDMKLLLSGNQICNKWLQRLMKNEFHIPMLLSGREKILNEAVLTLFSLLKEQKNGYEFMAQSMLYQVLGLSYGTAQATLKENNKSVTSRYIERLKEVVTFIETHYTEPITLEDMAEAAGLNPRYFCRFFKMLTDRTPIEYLNYYRIECACLALLVKDSSITEIAFNCGFNDSSYFIKVFHALKGMTPRQYRESEGIN